MLETVYRVILNTEEEKGFVCTVQNLDSDQSFLHPNFFSIINTMI